MSTHPSEVGSLGRWLSTRSYLEPLLDIGSRRSRKGDRTVSLVIPTLNEAPTIGTIVRAAVADQAATGLVDQVLVIDSGSTDDTVAIAAAAGAEVVDHREVLVGASARVGKGEALWKSLAVARGDLLVFVDGDLENFDAEWVARLVEPLLVDDTVRMVKGSFDRPYGPDSNRDGGRVTQLMARPLLSAFFPELLGLRQPLSGEFAARRADLLEVPFAPAYAVDIGLVIDLYQRWGIDALAQVELGERRHRHQPTAHLARMSVTLMHAVLRRAGVPTSAADEFVQVNRLPDALDVETFPIPVVERPPMADVLAAATADLA